MTGTGAYNVLNATIGSISEEGTESEIAPTLINIQEVNLNINDDDVSRIDFQDADDVTNLNVVRMTDTGASITLDNLAAGTDEIGIESATSQGTINLLYREDELTALDNTLALDVGQAGVVRLSMLNIAETGDSAEDQGFGFETVNMTTESLTNIDNIFIAPNANEDRDNGADQSFNLDANASTEINNLVANGVEFMSISADGEVMIAADEDDVLDPSNDGISTAELQMLTIDGSANVTIDGLDGDIDNNTTGVPGASADDTTLVVDASAMTGDLTLGVETGADGESADANYEDRADKDLSVTSGSGDDTIQVYTNLAGDIITNDGNDTVLISDFGIAASGAAYDAAYSLAYNASINAVYQDAYNAAYQPAYDNAYVAAYNAYILQNAGNPNAPTPVEISSAQTAADVSADAAADAQAQAAGQAATQSSAAIAAAQAAADAAGTLAANDVAASGLDLEGVSTIDTGAGDDTVAAGDMGVTFTDANEDGNDGYDDVTAARIITGDGNDSVTVGNLTNGQDWDNFDLNDANADDLYNIKAASISTGAGDDTVAFDMAAENAVVDTGADADTVNVELEGQEVLEGDTNANYTMLNQTSAGAIAGQTKEVKADGTADLLGAQLLLGEGDDVANFIDEESKVADTSTLIVGQDALLDGGAGNDVMNVTALDLVEVNTTTTADDGNTAAEEFNWDVDANITGIETANLTIANQIDNATALAVGDAGLENDNFELDGVIIADVMRFDTALTTINLDSQEMRMRQSAATEIWEAGQVTEFDLFNFREDIALTLKANEATGVDSGLRVDDTITDVFLYVDVDGARDHNDVFELDIQAGSESFDLSLVMGSTTTDTVGDAASATDDDDMLVENVVINLNDSESHAINMNNFGDAGHSDADVEGSKSVETSLTINDSKDGTTIVVTNVNADTITGMGAADFNITVDAANNYEITTGSGDDVINMIADDVRADDNVDDGSDADAIDATDEADYVDGGAGTDRLVVSGDDTLGTSNAPISGNTDDDVFEGLVSLEQLEINNDTGALQSNGVVLDEAAQDKTNLQEIYLTGNGAQNTNLTIGENFENDLIIDASTKDDGVAGVAGAATNLIIESQDSDSDTDLVNLDVKVNLQDGVGIDFENTGDNSANVAITATVSELAAGGTSIYEGDGAGDGEGTFDLRVQQGVVAGQVSEIDSITLVDTDDSGVIDAVALNGEQDNDSINVVVSDNWSESAFSFDASAIENNDQDADGDGTVTTAEYDASILTGGLTYNAGLETDATHTVLGTANNDNFMGGLLDDTFEGNSGDDEAFGDEGSDTLRGGAGKDELHGEEGADTIDGGDGDDRIWGDEGSDTLTGGAGADAFVFNALVESDGANSSTDTITDFETGLDTIEYTLNVSGAATVNLGRFAQVNDLGAGDNSLDGTAGAQVYGDGFWATNGGFVLDVDGNGDVTEGDDLQINSSNVIGAGDLDIDVNGGAGANLIRGGQGANEIDGGAAGDADNFVLVGSISATQAAGYQAAINNPLPLSPLIPGSVSDVLANSELTTTRDVSEVNAGDTLNLITGFDASDSVHVYGGANVALVNSGMGLNVGTVNIYSDVTMTVEQLLAADTLNFAGGADHTLTVIDVDQNGDIHTLTIAEIQDALSGNYANAEDFDADGNPLNVAGQTNGQTVILANADGSPVTINGVTITTAASEVDSINEGQLAVNGNVLTNEDPSLVSVKSVDNVDGNVGANIAGTYGSVTVTSSGAYVYSLNNGALNVESLGAGEKVTDEFAYTLQTAGGAESTTAFLQVEVTGVNDAAIITGTATGSVTEDALVSLTSGTLTATDIDANNNGDFAGIFAQGALGTASITSNGAWTYSVDNGNATVQALGATQSISDTFTVSTTDGTTATVKVTVNGSNDAAVITGTTTGTVTEDTGITTTGDLNHTDIDGDNADDVWQVVAGLASNNVAGSTFSITANGVWTYNLANGVNGAAGPIQSLGANESITDSFTVQAQDGTTKVVSIVINGSNDPALVGGVATGTVSEDGVLSASGTLTATDIDNNNPGNFAGIFAQGLLGNATITSGGAWTYTLDNANPAVQGLGATQSTTDTFTVSTSDGTTATVTVVVNGANDAAVITGAVNGFAVTEDGAPATQSGNLNHTDIDGDNPDDLWNVVAPGTASGNGFGTFSVTASGGWTYSINNVAPATNALGAGQVGNDFITLTTTDGTTQTVAVTVVGANDAAVINGATTGTVTEDAAPNNVSGTLTHTDVDANNPDNTFGTAMNVVSNNGYGTFSMTSNGTWTYNVDNANLTVNALGATGPVQTLTDSFTVSSTDNTAQVITVTINGANDAAVITGATSGSVTEDVGAETVTGNLNHTDVDADNADDTWNAVAAQAAGFGASTFSINANGVWTYNLDQAAAEALGAGESTTDSFVVSTADGTTQTVSITINGANDAPVVTTPVAFNTGGFSVTVTDADANDPLSLTSPVGTDSAVNNGAVTNFTVAERGSVQSNDLMVQDGTATVSLDAVLVEGTALGDSITSPGGKPAGIFGFGGADTLAGSAGEADYLSGGAGADTFVMGSPSTTGGDTIADFVSGTDFISFDVAAVNAATGSGFAAGAVGAGNFVAGLGAVAADGDDYFVYDTNTGVFSFDNDGSGGNAAVVIATLESTPVLLVTDLLYV